jgi:cell shape-determining protein MreC
MKKIKLLFIMLLSFGILTNGCSFVRGTKQNTKTQDQLNKIELKADATKDAILQNDKNKIIQAAIYSTGVKYSLNQVVNASAPVNTALKLNDRVLSIVGSPDLDEVIKIQKIVDLMNSAVKEEALKGQKLLTAKDAEIIELQKENTALQTKHEAQLNDFKNAAKVAAKQSDEKQTTLDQMSGNMGFNAIWWGLKHLFWSCLTYLLIFGIIFLLLRVFASTNPIAGAIFGIFNAIASGFISIIKGLTPKAISISNLVHEDEHLKYKNTLDKIVDTIETLKLKGEAANKTYTLSELLVELDKRMDDPDKEAIKDILKDQKWT